MKHVCVYVWLCGCVLSHCPSCRDKKNPAHRNTEQSKVTRGKNRVDMLSPCYHQLCKQRRLETFSSIFLRSHPLTLPSSVFLSLAVNSPCRHLFHRDFLPTRLTAVSFMLHTYTQYLCWHSCSSHKFAT